MGRTNSMNKQTINLIPHCKDTPSTFNVHFLKNHIGSNEIIEDYKQYLNNPPSFSMYLSPTNPNEVKSIVSVLKTNTHGYDYISPNLLKHFASIISTSITHIINLSLKTGTFPNKLKDAKVIPLFKPGDRHDINNYRPISILPALSKFLKEEFQFDCKITLISIIC